MPPFKISRSENSPYFLIIDVENPKRSLGMISPFNGQISVKEWLWGLIRDKNPFQWGEGPIPQEDMNYVCHTRNHMSFEHSIGVIIDVLADYPEGEPASKER